MRIPGSRTMSKYALKVQKFLYSALNLQRVPAEERRLTLVKAMGFEGQWDDHRAFQMEFLHRNGLTKDTRFLEIGSGPLTLGIPLIQTLNPQKYTGVDVRESVTNIAYDEISRAGLAGRNPRLIVSDNFGATALGDEMFDMIWSFSVLYHLSDDLIEEWFGTVKKRLEPEGRYWANFNDGMEEDRWLEFPFVRRELDFYEDIARKNGLELKFLGTLEGLGFAGSGAEKNNSMIEIQHCK